MSPGIFDVDVDSFRRIPPECQTALFWELSSTAVVEDANFQKEEWFSSTLLEWGTCGKLLIDDEHAIGFAQYAPATLFARLLEFPTGSVSDDAVYLGYCYLDAKVRGRGLGRWLVGAVARDIVERGYRALEAIGDREWDGGWVLPSSFLGSSGFTVLKDDPRYPLLRLDTREEPAPLEAVETAEVAVPVAEATGID
ncbi:MAG: GNAT family N-acetyltransferase [Actinomycetota bacterium]|nr:GNAT family N-acetyltransferase [Actinomycetota bacterium]